ncbi:MAG: hypothetical protein GF315_11715 [candidate division Zixibacteria bacterium]|nr:hypothetical protein [candidate division Zixibacteria bacterium]
MDVRDITIANKEKLKEREALDLVAKADKLYLAKGKKLVSYDLRTENPKKADMLEMMLGRTGNLRAPTIVNGKTVIVGFNEEVFKSELVD